jgi:hypothetical protein
LFNSSGKTKQSGPKDNNFKTSNVFGSTAQISRGYTTPPPKAGGLLIRSHYLLLHTTFLNSFINSQGGNPRNKKDPGDII